MNLLNPVWDRYRKFLFPTSTGMRVLQHFLFWILFIAYHLLYFLPSFVEILLEKNTLFAYILYYARFIPLFYLIIGTHTLLSRYLTGVVGYMVLFASGIVFIHLLTTLQFLLFRAIFGLDNVPDSFRGMADLYLHPLTERSGKEWIVVIYDFMEIQLLFLPIGIKMAKYGLWQAIIRRHIETESLQLELKVLRAQLDPHFVFNVINAAYARVLPVSEEAATYLNKLANLLRFPLYDTSSEFIALKKEIEFIREYAELEMMRHRHRLKVHYDQQGEISLSHQIPALLLITLIENAFKHGVHATRRASWIDINLQIIQDQLILEISNSKPENKPDIEPGFSGIGLSNVKKRLELYFPKEHTLEIAEESQTFRVTATIPLRHAKPIPEPDMAQGGFE